MGLGGDGLTLCYHFLYSVVETSQPKLFIRGTLGTDVKGFWKLPSFGGRGDYRGVMAVREGSVYLFLPQLI